MRTAAVAQQDNAITRQVLSQLATGDNALDEDGAATMIQKAMTRRYLGNNIVFLRQFLLQRILLELQLMRGLRLLMWCLLMFGIVIHASMLEKQGPTQFGLMKSFSSPALFQLDLDYLAEIRSPAAFMDYLQGISDGSHLLLPKSMEYMYEETSEIKVLAGVNPFIDTFSLDVKGLEPRVDSPSFSMMA